MKKDHLRKILGDEEDFYQEFVEPNNNPNKKRKLDTNSDDEDDDNHKIKPKILTKEEILSKIESKQTSTIPSWSVIRKEHDWFDLKEGREEKCEIIATFASEREALVFAVSKIVRQKNNSVDASNILQCSNEELKEICSEQESRIRNDLKCVEMFTSYHVERYKIPFLTAADVVEEMMQNENLIGKPESTSQ